MTREGVKAGPKPPRRLPNTTTTEGTQCRTCELMHDIISRAWSARQSARTSKSLSAASLPGKSAREKEKSWGAGGGD